MLTKIIQLIDFLLFPRACIACFKSGARLCLDCTSNLWPAREYRDEFTHSLFSYDDPVVRKAILRLKFCNDKTIVEAMAPHLADLITAILADTLDEIKPEQIILVPIPIGRKSYHARGYNQSLLITETVAKLTGLAVESKLLIKTRETQKQAKIASRELRLKNVVDSFGVSDKSKVKGKTIFLIDDVITTGATLREARGELLTSGAKRVFCITLASQPLM